VYSEKYRAGDEARTRDLQLGRLPLYQLSYSRLYPIARLLFGPAKLQNKFVFMQVVGETGFEPVKT
jgi:hypothetical protein